MAEPTRTPPPPPPPPSGDAPSPDARAPAEDQLPWLEELPPRKIVAELDRYIVGQDVAKKAVAIAIRNRWRRAQAPDEIRDEIVPNNIIMIGPTGVGKTEIARRLARLAGAPFLKVEASKFTEVGYVGRDVESMVRELVDVAINMVRTEREDEVYPEAEARAEERLLDILLPPVPPSPLPPLASRPGEGSREVGESRPQFVGSSIGGGGRERLVGVDDVVNDALDRVENHGVIFIDELDQCAGERGTVGPDVSREGVQRDLLPIVEGSTVQTRYGYVRTDHILFIAAGAFHVSKPSDLIPELQGRFPIRVELQPLTEEDFVRIMTEPENALTKQYAALCAAEGARLEFTHDGIKEVARIAAKANERMENIGARRLHTVMTNLLEDVLFDLPELAEKHVVFDAAKVRDRLAKVVDDEDLRRYIL